MQLELSLIRMARVRTLPHPLFNSQRQLHATDPEIHITNHGMAELLITRVDAHTLW